MEREKVGNGNGNGNEIKSRKMIRWSKTMMEREKVGSGNGNGNEIKIKSRKMIREKKKDEAS